MTDIKKYQVIRLQDPMGTSHYYDKIPRKMKKASKTFFRIQKRVGSFKGLVLERDQVLTINVVDRRS
jgi:hypothetical protein